MTAVSPGPHPREQLTRRVRLAAILLGGFVVLVLLMSTVLRVEGAVVGSGEVTVESGVKVISHAGGGVLAKVLVRNGDHVRAGQPLLQLDTDVTTVGSSSAETGYLELVARRARLGAERDGRSTIAFPPVLSSEAGAAYRARERRNFELGRRERASNRKLLGERIAQYEQEIAGYRAQIDAIDGQMKLIGPELEGVRKLYAQKLITVSRMNELERTAVQLQGTRASLESQIARARAHIAETQEQMVAIDQSRRTDAAAELAQIAPQLNDQEVRRASAQDQLHRSVIRAPQNGVIDKLAYTAIGSAIPAGQPILELVPDRDTLIVEAHIRPQDVDQLRIGQSARISFSGLDLQTTPELPGTVAFISPDLTRDSQTGASFYRIRVALRGDALDRNRIALKAGMPAEIFVVTGSRSILSYLLKPLADQVSRAFREG